MNNCRGEGYFCSGDRQDFCYFHFYNIFFYTPAVYFTQNVFHAMYIVFRIFLDSLGDSQIGFHFTNDFYLLNWTFSSSIILISLFNNNNWTPCVIIFASSSIMLISNPFKLVIFLLKTVNYNSLFITSNGRRTLCPEFIIFNTFSNRTKIFARHQKPIARKSWWSLSTYVNSNNTARRYITKYKRNDCFPLRQPLVSPHNLLLMINRLIGFEISPCACVSAAYIADT